MSRCFFCPSGGRQSLQLRDDWNALKNWLTANARVGYSFVPAPGCRKSFSDCIAMAWRCGQTQTIAAGGQVEFVMFEDVHGKEVYVNPSRVIWVREYGDQNTEISCGADDKFTVRLSPAQAVAVLGVQVR